MKRRATGQALAISVMIGLAFAPVPTASAGWFDKGNCRSTIREGETKVCSRYCWTFDWCGNREYTLRGNSDRFISQCAKKYQTDRYGNKTGTRPENKEYICQFRDDDLIIVWDSILYYHAVWKAEDFDVSEERRRLENR